METPLSLEAPPWATNVPVFCSAYGRRRVKHKVHMALAGHLVLSKTSTFGPRPSIYLTPCAITSLAIEERKVITGSPAITLLLDQ